MVRRLAAALACSLILGVLALSACKRSRTVVCGAVSGTAPAAFRVIPGEGDSMMMMGGEAVGMYRPIIHVHRRERPSSEADLRREHEKLSSDLAKLGHRVGKLEKVVVGGKQGWMYSEHYVESVAKMFASTAKDEPTRMVEHEKIEVLIPTQTDTYVVTLVCPVAFFGKYRPAFDGFLQSMRFAEQ